MPDWDKLLPYLITGGAATAGVIGASKAAGTQERAAESSNALLRDVFAQQQQNIQPYLDAGRPALNALSYGLGLAPYGPSPADGGGAGGASAGINPGTFGYQLNAPTGAMQPSIGGNALAGGAAGFTFGGPVGGAIGAGVGAVGSLFGRDRRARTSWVDQVQAPFDASVSRLMSQASQEQAAGTMTPEKAQAYQRTLDQMLSDLRYQQDQWAGEGGPEAHAADRAREFWTSYQDAEGTALPDQWRNTLAGYAQAAPRGTGPANAMLQGPANLGFGDFSAPFNFQEEPGYQFGLNRGIDALEASASARGSLGSGGALKALERYRQDYASTKYGEAFNRFQADRSNRFNQYAAVAGIGQTAAQQANAAAGSYGLNAAENLTGAGNALAAGTIGVANALAGGAGQAVNIWGQQQQNALLNSLLRGD